MMRISRHVLIARPRGEVFALVSDLARGPEWFAGITRWEPRSRKRRGVGARYRVLVKVGSIEAGGTLVVTEWKPSRTIAWEAADGVDQRGRWRLGQTRSGTELSLEVEFTLPGPFGWIVERLAGRAIARDMMATLLAARRILEFDDADRGPGSTRARAGGERVPSRR
jgi:uncharacterized membrane protein